MLFIELAVATEIAMATISLLASKSASDTASDFVFERRLFAISSKGVSDTAPDFVFERRLFAIRWSRGFLSPSELWAFRTRFGIIRRTVIGIAFPPRFIDHPRGIVFAHHFAEELARRMALQTTVLVAHFCIRNVENPFRSRHGDVHEASLFFDIAFATAR